MKNFSPLHAVSESVNHAEGRAETCRGKVTSQGADKLTNKTSKDIPEIVNRFRNDKWRNAYLGTWLDMGKHSGIVAFERKAAPGVDWTPQLKINVRDKGSKAESRISRKMRENARCAEMPQVSADQP
jgi:hypothetical protein